MYVGRPALWRAAESPLRDAPLLLDTHVWLWTLDGTVGALTKPAIRLIERAAGEGRLYVSDISFWEVAMLVSKGRLELAADPTLWLQRAALAPGIQLLPLTRDVLIESTRLAGPVAPLVEAGAHRSTCRLRCNWHMDCAGSAPCPTENSHLAEAVASPMYASPIAEA